MIGYVEGRVVNKSAQTATVLTDGVGYEVYLSESQLTKLAMGDSVTLYIHTHVREDMISLFGFEAPGDLEFFKMLLSVSGIGPKVALSIIASAPVPKLKSSISAGDSSLLSAVSGVGRKTAEKAVIELKNKLGYIGSGYSASEGGEVDEIIEALSGLGFQKSEVVEGIKKIPDEVNGVDEKIKYLVKNLGKR
jgi:Holliday junction DNA helicase RuvA